MQVVAWDLETHLIKPGCPAPKMVCLSYAYRKPSGEIEKGLLTRESGLDWFAIQVTNPHVRLVAHHAFFDLGVIAAERPKLLPAIFQAIDEGRITCTKIRQMMIDNAKGLLKFIEDENGDYKAQDFSLAALVKRHLNIFLSKGADTWRLRYNELEDVPLNEWPEAASSYAINDSVHDMEVYECQESPGSTVEVDPREIGQVQAAWALYLTGMWGIRTDRIAVEKLRIELTAEVGKLKAQLVPSGFVRTDGSRDTKAIKLAVETRYAELGKPVPLTETGLTCCDRDSLAGTKDPTLALVSEYVHLGKLLTTYVPLLLRGTEVPINASFNPILETYRTSCAKPNLQNPPRKGKVRDCFIPRPGFVFINCDFDTLEMRTLAQVCLVLLGYSAMAQALREGQDLHLALAAELLEITYEEAFKRYEAGDPEVEEARQFAKIPNFGCPGGLSPETLVDYARTAYGKVITLEFAKKLHRMFQTRWHEMPAYFKMMKSFAGADVCMQYVFPISGLVRGQVMYTALCNGNFQHLAAMGAKAALYAVIKECYLGVKPDGTPSPLAGCRVVNFLHDEIMLEALDDRLKASQASDRLREVMIEQMSLWVKDVPIKASSTMTRRWFKGAKAVKVNGLLVPSRPVKKDDRVVWEADLDERIAA
jgi:hypothetical protein